MSEYMIMAKPVGSRCNMACGYCYYLGKGQYSTHESQTVMSRPVLEKLIKQLISSSPEVTSIVWHGGEPTLAGLDFFREVMAIEKRYLPAGHRIWNNLQTNGMLIDEQWRDFLLENRWDVGVSIDGTRAAHDANRRMPGKSGCDGSAQSSWERTAHSIRMLRDAGIPVDLLCTVNSDTAGDPEGVYDALKAFDTGWMQFIPIVGAAKSVTPQQYGDFLCRIFDRWRSCGDVGRVHVQLFDETARVWRGMKPTLCWMQETCGQALIAEEDGAVYSCDHYVDPGHRLGYLQEHELNELADSDKQKAFGLYKRQSLCDECRSCRWLSVCGGGCPKDRLPDASGQPRYYLCEGLRMFWEHAHAAMTQHK